MSSQQFEQLHNFFYGTPSTVPITKIIPAQAVTAGRGSGDREATLQRASPPAAAGTSTRAGEG